MNILEFYRDKTIFITGTTGFVGKVVLEKLIRTVQNFKKIYIMVRAKKGISENQRLQDIFNSELFERCWRENPELRNKWH